MDSQAAPTPDPNATARQRHLARFGRVLAHIDSHLDHPGPSDEALLLDALSEVAHFSKHHFHRQFRACFGIGAGKYIQLLRLKRAAWRLAFRKGLSVTEIALASGYDSPESFSRAFKHSTGQSPSAFRRQPRWERLHEACQPLDQLRSTPMNPSTHTARVDIVDFKETRVAALEHRGDPRLVGDSVRGFIEWRKHNRLPPSAAATFNIAHDDPEQVDPAAYRIDLCAATDKDVQPNPWGVVPKTIPGGRCAVLRHTGTSNSLREAALFLYAQWLPQSGEEPRDFPLYFQRVSFFPDVPEHEAVTDIFLPLKPRA